MEKGQIVMHVLTGERVMIIGVYNLNTPEYSIRIRTRTYEAIDVKGFELVELEEEGE